MHYLALALSSMSHLICDSYLVLVVSTTYSNTFIQDNDMNVYWSLCHIANAIQFCCYHPRFWQMSQGVQQLNGVFTLDVKSVLNDNLGGILGGTHC